MAQLSASLGASKAGEGSTLFLVLCCLVWRYTNWDTFSIAIIALWKSELWAHEVQPDLNRDVHETCSALSKSERNNREHRELIVIIQSETRKLLGIFGNAQFFTTCGIASSSLEVCECTLPVAEKMPPLWVSPGSSLSQHWGVTPRTALQAPKPGMQRGGK